MNPLLTKQGAALASLVTSISGTLIAFNLVNATVAGAFQALASGIVSAVLYYLHRKDAAA